jgi:poly(3-hydroxybutyrate) depolymerase
MVRKFASRLTAVAAIVAGISLGASSIASAATYQAIMNGSTGTCMSSLGGGVNSELVLYACNRSANQLWTFVNTASGTEIKNDGDGLCVSDRGYLANNDYQYMESCNGNANQSYYMVNLGHIEPDGGLAGYSLTSGGETGNGVPVYEYGTNNSSNQTWSWG